MPAPRRALNPFLLRRVRRSGKPQRVLAIVAGYTHPNALYTALHAHRVRATAQAVARLERVADAVGFPKDELFLDGGR